MSKAVCYFGSYDPDYARNRIIVKGLKANGVKVYQCQASGLIFSRYLKLLKYFIKYKDQYHAIIVGFPGHYDVPLAFILGKLFGKKTFYDIFTSTYETYVLDREVIKKDSFRSRFFYFIDWLGLKLADYVIIDTLAHGRFYDKLYGLNSKKQILIYVGSDIDYFYPRKLKEETDVLFYGSYQPLQGADVIIKTASLLPNVKFKMIGKGQTRANCEALAKKLRLANVEFINWLPLEKLAQEISKSKVALGIFGSSIKTSLVIPNKIYDYLAMGKLVITANTQASKELLKSGINAVLIPTGDFSVLAGEIDELLRNSALRQKIADNGYVLLRSELKPNLVIRDLISKIDER
ncbi:MAG: glycosyltransferase [Patescibacteria group bacterium]